jgi:hypothetical protein
MNWDAIGAVGEIVGAVAVVISLIYLAAQIRNQNRESRLTRMHEMSHGFREATSKLLDAEVTDIFVKAIGSFESLTDGERLNLIIGMTAIFRAWEEAFIQRVHFDDRFRDFVDGLELAEYSLWKRLVGVSDGQAGQPGPLELEEVGIGFQVIRDGVFHGLRG